MCVGVKKRGERKRRKKKKRREVCTNSRRKWSSIAKGRGGRNERRADVRRWRSGRVKSRQQGRERREKGKVKNG